MQIGGDVVATNNAWVVSASGAGGAPSLIPSGDSTSRARTSRPPTTQRCQGLTISAANAVNFGNAANFNGNVVVNGGIDAPARSSGQPKLGQAHAHGLCAHQQRFGMPP